MRDVLAARSALGRAMDQPPQVFGSPDTVLVAERRVQAMVTLRFDEANADQVAALAARTGLQLQGRGRAVTGDIGSALWLGPGEWLIAGASHGLADRVDPASLAPGSVAIDTSDAWFVVRVSGVRARDVLAQGCALDLAPGRFTPGACAVTPMARIHAVIHHVDAAPAYDLYVERSYASYLWAWLCDAMAEFRHFGEH